MEKETDNLMTGREGWSIERKTYRKCMISTAGGRIFVNRQGMNEKASRAFREVSEFCQKRIGVLEGHRNKGRYGSVSNEENLHNTQVYEDLKYNL